VKLVSLRLPAALGGQLDIVHGIVETFLAQVTDAGDEHPYTLARVQSRIESAVAKTAQRRYIDAYQDYCMAPGTSRCRRGSALAVAARAGT
jgi:hypothetical protein